MANYHRLFRQRQQMQPKTVKTLRRKENNKKQYTETMYNRHRAKMSEYKHEIKKGSIKKKLKTHVTFRND